MLKRRDSPYVAGRRTGLWYKWKRDPLLVDCVLMYAQRGSGKRSSFYSDYTFGCWDGDPDAGAELLPVGKAYFGFTDDELKQIDRYVRNHTVNRFGPGARDRPQPGVRGRVRQRPREQTPQVGAGDALSADQPNPLGQAGTRGRPDRRAQGLGARLATR
jgi:ATP-dependent DNA ligase